MDEHATKLSSDSAILRQLTAYLDGELAGVEFANVEERLATDDKYRDLMQQLQRTWDFLDVLPLASANSSFTQSTMKLAISDARKLAVRNSRSFWTWPARILALVLIPAIASGGTFLASRYIQDRPTKQLIQNLPVINNLDVLNCDHNLSIGFLEQLSLEGDLFGIALQTSAVIDHLVSPDSGQKLFDELSTLPVVELNQIRINNDKFLSMTPDQQARVTRLHADLSSHPDRERLESVLLRYNTWLDSLGETDRARIQDTTDVKERVDRLKEITEEQFYRNFGKTGPTQLPPDDVINVYLGFLDLIQNPSKARQIRDAISLEENILISLDARSKKFDEEQQRIYTAGRQLQVINEQYPERIDEIITHSDVQRLRILLSDDAKTLIEWVINWQGNQGKSEAQLLASWMLEVFDARFNPVTPRTLQEFYNTLPTVQKDQIDNEFPEHRIRKLKELYHEQIDH